jgi:hypothetical protein
MDLVLCEVQTAEKGFDLEPVEVKFMVNKQALRQVYLRVSVLRCQYYPTKATHPCSSQYCSLSERLEAEDCEPSNKAILCRISQEHCKGKYIHIAFILIRVRLRETYYTG